MLAVLTRSFPVKDILTRSFPVKDIIFCARSARNQREFSLIDLIGQGVTDVRFSLFGIYQNHQQNSCKPIPDLDQSCDSSVGYNNITDQGVLALLEAMLPGRKLELVVSGNSSVSEQVLYKLERALDKQWVPVKAAHAMRLTPAPARAETGAATRSSIQIARECVEVSNDVGGAKRPRFNDAKEEARFHSVSARAGARTERRKEHASGRGGMSDGEVVGKDVHVGVPLTYRFTDINKVRL